jgi:SAM-dependent methyltransferase
MEWADVETSSDGYARRFAGAVGHWMLERQTACTAELLRGMPAGTRVLDVGGGHAQLMPLLADRRFDVTVVGSTAACAARLTPWIHEGMARFTVGDLLGLPYPDRSFDVVLSFRLLPHVAAWPRLVAELCRVSARVVVVDYPSKRSVNILADRLFAAKQRVEGDTRPFTVFDPRAIATAFESQGFAVTGERGQFVVPMAVHRAIGSAPVARVMEALLRSVGLAAALGSPRIARADRLATPGPAGRGRPGRDASEAGTGA